MSPSPSPEQRQLWSYRRLESKMRLLKERRNVIFQASSAKLWEFGVVVDTDESSKKCVIRTLDGREIWKHIHEVNLLDSDLSLCNGLESDEDAKWLCAVPKHVLEARTSLPYSLDELEWDDNHLWNKQQKYCYCGVGGTWYRYMLQCDSCQQWFHRECIKCPVAPKITLMGDHFLHFVCALCSTDRKERMKRPEMSMADLLHLALFHQTISHNQTFHHLESSVLQLVRTKSQELPLKIASDTMTGDDLKAILCANKKRFKCASDEDYWGLRNIMPLRVPGKSWQSVALDQRSGVSAVPRGRPRHPHRGFASRRFSAMPTAKLAVSCASRSYESFGKKGEAKRRGRPPLKNNSNYSGSLNSESWFSLDEAIPFCPENPFLQSDHLEVSKASSLLDSNGSVSLSALIKISGSRKRKAFLPALAAFGHEKCKATANDLIINSTGHSLQPEERLLARRISLAGNMEYLTKRRNPQSLLIHDLVSIRRSQEIDKMEFDANEPIIASLDAPSAKNEDFSDSALAKSKQDESELVDQKGAESSSPLLRGHSGSFCEKTKAAGLLETKELLEGDDDAMKMES